MMQFREKFEKSLNLKGFQDQEKDSEEFLTILLENLKSEPLLKFRFVINNLVNRLLKI
jgi:hypothetical protein